MSEDKARLLKEAKRRVMQDYMARWPLFMAKKVTETFGEKGWQVIEEVARTIGRERAQLLKEALEIDVNDARSLGKVFDFEDSMNGVSGEWIEATRKRAVKKETQCVAAEIFKDFPEYCGRLMCTLAKATIEELNPKAKLNDFSSGKLLAKGDDYCQVCITIED
ncbi:MAG: L-2-amino-thiazoline-4-carboxylic acid hydrolase [Candidatus Tectomicrobia bacterium]|uniref:L-2-amino-thiazoline-4-carboxylic acid hydrolase n=1 Tax=Tectimicrobiota bacterium TaxID=2528274 RepID=A0A933GNU8_UNCTE|nr:L-2-amino-thiazoline-4-carboxylic acid hydrolase [Candidatus Tectomicrobia bacterium]